MNTRFVSALLGVAGVVAFLFAARAFVKQPVNGSFTTPPKHFEELSTLDAVGADTDECDRAGPVVSPSKRSLNRRTKTGQIVSATTARNVRAKLEVGGCHAYSDDFGGRFYLDASTCPESDVTVSASGYRTRTIGFDELAENSTIALDPITRISVVVQADDGTAIPEAAIILPATENRGLAFRSQELTLGETGDDGHFEFQSADSEIVIARKGTRVSAPVRCRPDGVRSPIVLHDTTLARVGIRTQVDGTPLQGVSLRLLRFSDHPPTLISTMTDSEGLSAARLALGLFEVTVTDGSASLLASREGASGVISGGKHKAFIEIGAETTAVWLEALVVQAREIIALDASSNQPVASVTVWFSARLDLKGDWMNITGPLEIATRDGVVSLAVLGLDSFEQLTPNRLSVCAPGYGATIIDNPTVSLLPGRPEVVRLEPSKRRSLRVLSVDGSPYRRAIVLTEVPSRIRIHDGAPDPSGLIGPFDWHEGDIVVGPGLVVENDTPRVSAHDLIKQNQVDLELDASAMIDVVLPLGREVNVVCRDEDGSLIVGSQVGPYLRFDQLRPGVYEVGPVEFLATRSLRTLHGSVDKSVVVTSGVRRIVEWDPAWQHVASFRGRAEVRGTDARQLFAAPLFEPLDVPILGGRAHQRYSLMADGSWSGDDLWMQPVSVAIGRMSRTGDEILLAVGDPEATILVEVKEVTLGVPESFRGAQYTLSYQPLSGVRGGLIRASESGVVNGDIVIPCVPIGVTKLDLRLRDRAKVISIDLEPGQQGRIEVSP